MKKLILLLALLLLCGISACGAENNEGPAAGADRETIGEETEVKEFNRSVLAEVLGIEENARCLRFILSGLDNAGVGRIRSAGIEEAASGTVIRIVAEDDTVYRVYLSGNGGLDAVENVTTGEWPVRSMR